LTRSKKWGDSVITFSSHLRPVCEISPLISL
jgi:hypothetical protein